MNWPILHVIFSPSVDQVKAALQKRAAMLKEQDDALVDKLADLRVRRAHIEQELDRFADSPMTVKA